MGLRRFVTAGILGGLVSAAAVLGPTPASASNMFWQQAILLVHIPLSPAGTFFTTNLTFTASEGANTTINVKCFNDALQRVGPAAGVNIPLNAVGQLAQATPTTLLVTTDPLFTGVGWCWANNVTSGNDFNVQITVGSTTDLTPGGILTSSASTFVASNTGLAEVSEGLGGIPVYTTTGGTQNFAVLVNPLTTAIQLTLQLYDSSGVQQGSTLVRSFAGRSLQVLSIPAVFGATTPPATGSVRISSSANGFLGWFVTAQPSTGRAQFTAIGLDLDDASGLPPASAP
jgi:hypothetical protein